MDRGYVVDRKIHPKDRASIWSLLSFSYIHSYIRRGNQRDLNEDDICEVYSKLNSSELGERMERLWNEQKVGKNKKRSIVKLLRDCFLKKFLLLGIFQLAVKVAYITLMPRSVGKLVSYFKEGQTEISNDDAWYYGIIVIITSSAYLFYEHHYHLLKSEFAFEMGSSFGSLIYRKSLKLSPAKLSEISTGKVVIAITKDIGQVEDALYFLNDLWVELIQAAVALYLLYMKLGTSGVAGLSTVLIIIGFQLYAAHKVLKKRTDANAKSDQRLQLTQEVITAIRVLKMYAWEKFFAKKVIHFRKLEIQKLRSLTLWKFFAYFLGNLSNKLSFLFVVLFYIWFGHNLSAEVVYFVTTCFQRLRRTLGFIIPMSCGSLAEFTACARRLEFIMNAEEINPEDHDHSKAVIIPKVDFISADIGVGKIQILSNINMKLKPGLNVLIGPVGCGKSSLTKAILKEFTLMQGKVNIEGTVSYSPQNPWLFPSSIKQNIIFGQPYDEKKYKNILEISALKLDLDGLAQGDETILNDCGVNLSKGQQSRVNIARALYKNSDIYIFDDSFSSLDSHVKSYIFQNSIKTFLKDKLVIFATHDSRFVDKADNVIIMLGGTVTYSGKPKDIPKNLSQSLESLNKDLCESDEDKDREVKEIDEDKPCNEATELLPKLCTSDKANIYHETLFTGSIGWKYYKKYFGFGGGFSIFFIVFSLYISVEALTMFSEKLMTKWVLVEEKMSPNSSELINSTVFNSTSSTAHLYATKMLENVTSSSFEYEEENGSNDYTYEYSTTDSAFYTSPIEFIKKMGNITLDMNSLLDQRAYYIHWYSSTMVLSSILTFVSITVFYIFSLKVSKNLHKAMITNILGSKMSFYDVNMSGNILNRFSKDLFTIDEWIPFIINEAMRMITMMTATGLLIASISFTFTVITIVLVLIFFFASKYCIRPARTLRRLDMATRSPLIGHLNTTLEGLITIRAYGTQSILINEFDKHQNHFMAAHHLFEILMRCLSFSLHMLSAVYISILILGFLIKSDSSSNVGLAITQSFILSNFLDWGLRQWVMLESTMTNFQRASEYTEVEQESQKGETVQDWPTSGCIQYKDVSLTYRENNETVLKNLNFVINPKEKIGIVGRTGAGKSSIIVTLFRLYEVNGDIIIDGINIKSLALDYLRHHIGIIPQDPILFSGSVRANIDPLNKYSDNDIWQALSAVNLKSAIKDLNEDVHESGLTHSVGQRQLICLARAIIRKTKIMILDEATANMDEDTDHFIHKKIEELFKDCTTITVAHRLNSVMRCDRVIVMDKGEIIEFDSPSALLENKDSVFYKMVHHHDNS